MERLATPGWWPGSHSKVRPLVLEVEVVQKVYQDDAYSIVYGWISMPL